MEDERSLIVEAASPVMREVEVSKEPVELYKILKFELLVPSGGEAKAVILAGLVRVNGQVETRKRKKIVHGDSIEFAGASIRIKLSTGTGEAEEKPESMVAPDEPKDA